MSPTQIYTISRFLLAFLMLCDVGLSLTIDVVGQPSKRNSNSAAGRLPLKNRGDILYTANITLGGVDVEVQVDFGSADLWTNVSIPNSKNLSFPPIQHPYATGQVEGFIFSAPLELGGYKVSDQVYLQVTNETNLNLNGLIGIAPHYDSFIWRMLNSSAGTNAVDHLFQENPSVPSYVTALLTRSADDAAGTDALDQKGQFTVGTVVQGLEDIQNQPKLPSLKDDIGRLHWGIQLDENSVLGPDKQPIPVLSQINISEGSQHLRAAFDTGADINVAPEEIVDAIYGRVPNATLLNSSAGGAFPTFWSVPCDFELNTTFVIGGVKFPIAPLDMSVLNPEAGEGMCMANMQAPSAELRDSTGYDILLGMPFLRNAYLLVDYGNFIEGSSSSAPDPYVQLLPLTNEKDAHHDFVIVRQGGNFSYVQPPLLSPTPGQNSSQPNMI